MTRKKMPHATDLGWVLRGAGKAELDRVKRHFTPLPPTRQRRPPKDNSAASQRARILAHLQAVGPLTTLEARHLLDVMHPGMRICELRKAGYPIVMVWCWDTTPEGSRHRVGRYFLRKGKQLSLPGFVKRVEELPHD